MKLQDQRALCPIYEAYDHIGAGDAFGIYLLKNLFQSVGVSHDVTICYGNPLIGIIIDKTRVVIGKHTRRPLERT